MNHIDYQKLGQAQAAYEALGYKPVEVPWRVSIDTINVTKPTHAERDDYVIAGTNKALLASGEQGFLYLLLKGFLPVGKYQTITPCFRNEAHDRYHSKQFMKLELIELLAEPIATNEQIEAMLHDALGVFKALSDPTHTRIVYEMTHNGLTERHPDPTGVRGTRTYDAQVQMPDLNPDATARCIEIGSYGARRCAFGTWIYGTGLAEPRFSRALAELQRLR